MPRLHVETEDRATVTRYGGLALAEQFWRRFGVAALIDEHVEVLKLHLPYHESDHVLAQVLNLYAGGTCIEDMMHLQHDEAVLRMFGVWCVRDIDSHIKPPYGLQKEGADFSYGGRWSYQPVLVSMASTGECLAVRNRPGNADPCAGADELVRDVLEQATALPDSAFRPFRTRAARQRDEGRKRAGYKPRRKKGNQKHKRARERGYRELRLVKQWVAETTYKPEGQPNTYRLIVRRQLIENHKGQRHLFDTHRDRYVVTNLPASVSAEEAIDMTYERCDQENAIEQNWQRSRRLAHASRRV